MATAALLDQLDAENRFADLRRATLGDRRYVAIELADSADTLAVGLRKLGTASLKGLDKLAVFEVVDLGSIAFGELDPLHGPGLMAAVEREFASGHHGRTALAGG